MRTLEGSPLLLYRYTKALYWSSVNLYLFAVFFILVNTIVDIRYNYWSCKHFNKF